MKTALIIGTRPDVLKMASLIEECPHAMVINLGQHGAMVTDLINGMGLRVTVHLSALQKARSLNELAGYLYCELPRMFDELEVDRVVVYGDTLGAYIAAMVAYHMKLEIVHVEAGLRSWDKNAPYPEETYRRSISLVSDWNFCPTEGALFNLREDRSIGSGRHSYVVGNTIIDVIDKYPAVNPWYEDTILVTLHRRENHDDVERVMNALNYLAAECNFRAGKKMVFQAHPNPAIRSKLWVLSPDIDVIGPMNYWDWVPMLRGCFLVLTDSGGIQEECTYLGKRCFVMRDVTERPEAVESGVCSLVGTDPDVISQEVLNYVVNPVEVKGSSVFGDGHAAERIKKYLSL